MAAMESSFTQRFKVIALCGYAGVGALCCHRLLYGGFERTPIMRKHHILLGYSAHVTFAFTIAAFWETIFEQSPDIQSNESLRKAALALGTFYSIPLLLSLFNPKLDAKISKYICSIVTVEKTFAAYLWMFEQRCKLSSTLDVILFGDVIFGVAYSMITYQLFKNGNKPMKKRKNRRDSAASALVQNINPLPLDVGAWQGP